eukprot:g3480.t1
MQRPVTTTSGTNHGDASFTGGGDNSDIVRYAVDPPIVGNMTTEDEDDESSMEVVRAVQIRDEYVERLMELVAYPSTWQKLKPELTAVLDVVKLATVELCEAVLKWRRKKTNATYPFVWNGQNVLLRMASQLDFLDKRPRLREWISVPSLKRNPMLQIETLDDVAENDRPSSSTLLDDIERETTAGLTSTRVTLAVWSIIDEERLHGRIQHSITTSTGDKLRRLRKSARARSYLRRSQWSTWRDFRSMLRKETISLNPIEMEWLMKQVGSGERKQRVNHKKLRENFLEQKRRIAARGERGETKKGARKEIRVDELMPKWSLEKSRMNVRRLDRDIEKIKRSMVRLASEMKSVEASLAACGDGAPQDDDTTTNDGASIEVSSPPSPSHAIVWRRNQLYKRKIQLEAQRAKLDEKLVEARRKKRHFEASAAASNREIRKRDDIARRVRRQLLKGRSQLRSSDARKKSPSKIQNAHSLKVKVASSAAAVALTAARRSQRIARSTALYVDALKGDDAGDERICVLRVRSANVPVEDSTTRPTEAKRTVSCAVRVFNVDSGSATSATATSSSKHVMQLSLPKSRGFDLVVIPHYTSDVENESWNPLRDAQTRYDLSVNEIASTMTRAQQASRIESALRFAWDRKRRALSLFVCEGDN